MKTMLMAATLAALSVTANTPVQAASTPLLATSPTQMPSGSFERKGRGCPP